jgi:hypothetical protein
VFQSTGRYILRFSTESTKFPDIKIKEQFVTVTGGRPRAKTNKRSNTAASASSKASKGARAAATGGGSSDGRAGSAAAHGSKRSAKKQRVAATEKDASSPPAKSAAKKSPAPGVSPAQQPLVGGHSGGIARRFRLDVPKALQTLLLQDSQAVHGQSRPLALPGDSGATVASILHDFNLVPSKQNYT